MGVASSSERTALGKDDKSTEAFSNEGGFDSEQSRLERLGTNFEHSRPPETVSDTYRARQRISTGRDLGQAEPIDHANSYVLNPNIGYVEILGRGGSVESDVCPVVVEAAGEAIDEGSSRSRRCCRS